MKQERPYGSVSRYFTVAMAPYTVILMLLYIVSYFSNQSYSQNGVNTVVTLYVYLFAFLFVYIITSTIPNDITACYKKSGSLGLLGYIFETKVIPFFLIYVASIVTMVLQNVQGSYWPFDAAINIFDDSMANLVVYSISLMYVMRIKKRPYITVPLYLLFFYAYNFSNNYFYSNFSGGSEVIFYKIVKGIGVLTLMMWSGSFSKSRLVKTVLLATVLSLGILSFVIATYHLQFVFAKEVHIKNRVAIKLVENGHPHYMGYLVDNVFNNSNVALLEEIYPLFQTSGVGIEKSSDQWNSLLFTSDVAFATRVAPYMLKEGVVADAKRLISFVYAEKSLEKSSPPESQELTRLVANSIQNQSEIQFLQEKMGEGGRYFYIWGVMVLGEANDCSVVDSLLMNLVNRDEVIASTTYDALRTLTGVTPRQSQGHAIYSIEVIEAFKKFADKECEKR